MNEKNLQEIDYRRLAFKFFDKGKSAAQILARIPRSRSWLFKWKQRFAQQGWQALDSRPKTPLNSPQEHSPEVVDLVLGLRQRLEKSKVGLVGPRAIQQEILRLRLLKSPPSLASIKRWLKDAGVTNPTSAPDPAAYYPVMQAADAFVIYACDWLARYLTGGEKVFIFHTINWRTQALSQTILTDKTTASAYDHLLGAFRQLGLPDFLQLDNDAAFTGLGRTRRVFGKIIRLVLYLGIELIFIPPGEPKRNHLVERLNGLWAESFWNKDHFRSRRDLLRKSPKFFTWYENYAPPALQGLTVKQAAKLQGSPKLLCRQMTQIPQELPLTAGRLHFIRRVDAQGEINILKEQWKISKSLAGRYVWATLNTRTEELSIYHRHSLRAQAKLIKQHVYEIDEPVPGLLPEFKRRPRPVEVWKII